MGPSVPERFSDPLTAAVPDGGARARARLRLAGALLFGAGALTMAAVLAAPDPDTSDHTALATCAGVWILVAALLVAWRTAPNAILHAICPAGTLSATAAVAFAEPVGLTPIFYLWPMLVAAYFLGRREVMANLAFVRRHARSRWRCGSTPSCGSRCSSPCSPSPASSPPWSSCCASRCSRS